MNDEEEILTFELRADKLELEIHLNEVGLKNLRQYLKNVERTGDHQHLMTENWGGCELTSEKQGSDNELLEKVTVFFWPDGSSAPST